MLQDLIQVAVACFAGLLVAEPLSRACRRAGWLDPPGAHKTHAEAVPFGGVLYVLPVWWMLWLFDRKLEFWIGGGLLLVGLIEDTLKTRGRELPWWLRLAIFTGLMTMLVVFADRTHVFEHSDTALFRYGGVLALVLGLTAFNWFDHADGLCVAAGLGPLIVLALGGGDGVAIAVGVLLAFLWINGMRKEGALLYLGDAGAQLLGYCIVIFGLEAGRRAYTEHLPPALLFMALPLFDFVRVIGLRLLERQHPWTPDHEHHLGHRPWTRRLPRGVLPGFALVMAFLLSLLGLIVPGLYAD